MISQPHTPDIDDIRLAHAESVTFHLMEEPELTEANNMFDRWLATIEAAAEQRGLMRGWDEGCAAGLDAGLTIGEISMGLKERPIPAEPKNPYRADQIANKEGNDVERMS